MELYQITEITEKFNNAGTKANADVVSVAADLGFKPVPVHMVTTEHSIAGKLKRQLGYYKDWGNVTKHIPPAAVVLLQHPFHHKQLTREKCLRRLRDKGVRYISLVHDVEELRGFRYNRYYKKEFQTMLELSDVLIVHNEVMKQWFADRGVSEEKMVTLGIFDYLQDRDLSKKTFKSSLTVAGNLDTVKCGYIAELGKLEGIECNLYGANFDEKLHRFGNITFHGELPIDVIPSVLTEGFGLVWDGNSIDGCTGEAGQYLRYNNPHKLSLYISSGLPVVIWSGAAEAGFVMEKKLGISVDSLEELSSIFRDMTVMDYKKLCENVNRVSDDLCSGEYVKKALIDALHRINNNDL